MSDAEPVASSLDFDDRSALREVNSGFITMVQAVDPGAWRNSTPCAKWDVRALVRHVVRGHARMTGAFAVPPYPGTAPPPEEFDRDRVGTLETWCGRVESALTESDSVDRLVRHRALGEMTGRAYVRVRWVDVLVHTWDLSQAIGRKFEPRRDLAGTGLHWAQSYSEALKASGAFAQSSVQPELVGDPFTELLVEIGRSPKDCVNL